MKKILTCTIAAFAMANAVFAQSAKEMAALETKANAAVDKVAAKVKKAEDAAALKAFKEKQKADLAAFIEAQKTGKTAAAASSFKVVKPALANVDEETAYFLGIAQSNGLKEYATGQLGVDESLLGKFAEGIMNRANNVPIDKETKALSAGDEIGTRIVDMAKSFSKDYYTPDEGKSVNPAIVASGIVAGLLGQNDVSVDSAAQVFQKRMTERQAANKEKLYGANREAGKKFLEENRTKPGVVSTASGLQYKILTQGTGAKPTSTQKVTVDYEGKLIDGTVFDSSYERGEPATFGVTQVIAGWTEALQLMPVGSKWELYIPYELAYGEQDMGNIKPYSTLIFTVELKDVK
ncbi:MAG: FKBP-type peptidyl-prolyl cis-trans isomerase [Bacteroidaceae bacterium]|nr:FKBP-type peptidyl-prolyl cis-trans isomerase [Bacteroidaceae bacterium]